MKIENKIEEKVWKQNRIEQDDVVLAAVSGGADSVCLLLLLVKLQEKVNFELEVIHVEHGIRGEESRRDAAFVQELCGSLGVAQRCFEVDVPAYAKEHGIGTEEAARNLRYRAFRKAAEEYVSRGRKVKIALAHHADDNAETILFQMVRGSGLDGMAGMRLERPFGKNVWLIRPLLDLRKAEIESYLAEKNQAYCTDSTNGDVEYSRNKIRCEVMPLLEEINAQAVAHIGQSAKMMAEVADYLGRQAQEAYLLCRSGDGESIAISGQLWERYPVFLQKEVLHLALAEAAGGEKDLTREHVEALWELGKKQVGRRLDLPQNTVAFRSYEGIFLDKKKAVGPKRRIKAMEERGDEVFVVTAEALKAAESPEGWSVRVSDGVFHFRIFHFRENKEQISRKTYTKWLNYDRISHELQIRRRGRGDYLTIDETGHTKKLQDYFVEEKIPQEERDNIWLLTEEYHVLWVVGKRISSNYKVSEDTGRVLEVQFLEEM